MPEADLRDSKTIPPLSKNPGSTPGCLSKTTIKLHLKKHC